MHVLKSGGFVVLAALVFSGCSFLQGDVQVDQPKEERPPVNESVENFEAYKKAKDIVIATGNTNGLELCKKYEDFESQVQDGVIEELNLFKDGNYSLNVYKTENYSGFTNPMISDYNTKCIEGAGSNAILKAFPEHLIWGFPSCSAGAAPESSDPEYQAFIDCQEVAEELQEYLSS